MLGNCFFSPSASSAPSPRVGPGWRGCRGRKGRFPPISRGIEGIVKPEWDFEALESPLKGLNRWFSGTGERSPAGQSVKSEGLFQLETELFSITRVDRPLVGRHRIFGVENQNPPVIERQNRCFPGRLFADPPIGRRRFDLVGPTPLRRHIERFVAAATRRADRAVVEGR